MRTRLPLLILGAIGLVAGCASVPLPPEAAVVRLIPEPSKSVAVYQPKLIVKDGRLILDGWVYRQFGAQTTAKSHIDVAFLDAAGRVLRCDTVQFAPRDLRGGSHRMQPRGHYVLPIAVLPAGTVSIQVKAHDDPHP